MREEELPKRVEALLLLLVKEVAVRRGRFWLLLVERYLRRVVGRVVLVSDLPTEEAEDPILVVTEGLLLLVRWMSNLWEASRHCIVLEPDGLCAILIMVYVKEIERALAGRDFFFDAGECNRFCGEGGNSRGCSGRKKMSGRCGSDKM